MNCDEVRVLLSAYLDGELSSGELLRVEQHLRRCHSCADEVNSLRQTVALVASMDEVELPATFHVQLHNRLVALGPAVPAVGRIRVAPGWQRNLGRWAVPAAAAAAALAVGLTSLPHVARLAVGLEGPQSNFSVVPAPQLVGTAPNKPDVTLPPAPPPVAPPSPGQHSGPDTTSPTDKTPSVQSGAPTTTAPNPPVTQPPVTTPDKPVTAPPIEPEPAKGENVAPVGSGTVATPAPDQPPPAALTPKNTISSEATVTTASPENVTKALAAFRPMVDGDRVYVQLPADQRMAVEDALKQASGVQVVSGFQVKQIDLAGQIHSLEGKIAFYRSQAENLEKQIPKLNGREQEDAFAEHKMLMDNIDHETETLRVVNSQVDMAIITVHLKVQGR